MACSSSSIPQANCMYSIATMTSRKAPAYSYQLSSFHNYLLNKTVVCSMRKLIFSQFLFTYNISHFGFFVKCWVIWILIEHDFISTNDGSRIHWMLDRGYHFFFLFGKKLSLWVVWWSHKIIMIMLKNYAKLFFRVAVTTIQRFLWKLIDLAGGKSNSYIYSSVKEAKSPTKETICELRWYN